MALFKLKTLSTHGIQWTGKNSNDVIEFLKEKGYTEITMERRVDTPIWVKVGSDNLVINRHEYVTVDEKGAIETVTETDFEDLWEEFNGEPSSAIIADNSGAFRQFLMEQGINYIPYGEHTKVPVDVGVDLFKLGEKWADYRRAKEN